MIDVFLTGYVGPGPGLSMMWALIGLAVTLLSAFAALLSWPVRAFLRKRKQSRQQDAATHSETLPRG